MKSDPLLDMLVPEDPVLSTSLDQTLRAVRRRRHLRTATRSALAAAGVLLVAVGLFRRPPAESGPVARVPTPPAVEVPTLALQAAETVSTLAAPSGFWVTPEAASVTWIATDTRARMEFVDDSTLLALAPGCLALTRDGRNVKAVWLCDDLLAQP